MGRHCVFCASSGPVTGEDVLPRWLYRATGSLPLGRHFVSHDDAVVRSWPGLPYHTTTNQVCAQCNHGWMSRLESVSGTLLRSAIRGTMTRRRFNGAECATLARWAQKTAMCIQLPDELHIIPRSHYSEIYERRISGFPLDGCQAWIGRFVPTIPQVRHRLQPLPQLNVNGRPLLGFAYPPYATTIAVGHVAIQTVMIDEEGTGVALNFTGSPVRDATMLQIWPPAPKVEWPPPASLTERGYHQLSRFLIGPPSIL